MACLGELRTHRFGAAKVCTLQAVPGSSLGVRAWALKGLYILYPV